MSIIIVNGHEIETKNITKIIEAGWRKCGFEIHMIGPKIIKIQEDEPWDASISKVQEINNKYRRLRQKIESEWEKDKTQKKILNL